MIGKFTFIGPVLQARKETVEFPFSELDPEKKLIYVSMGTLYKPDISFFKTCLIAFDNKPFNVIISIGKSTNISDLGTIPKNIFIKPYVPQLLVLERTAVFVSHGGMGGVNEAMFYNVPMLILPKTIEQQINARRIEELGAGLDLRNQEVAPEVLFAGVMKLLSNNSYIAATKKISKSFKVTGGVGPAAEGLEKMFLESKMGNEDVDEDDEEEEKKVKKGKEEKQKDKEREKKWKEKGKKGVGIEKEEE